MAKLVVDHEKVTDPQALAKLCPFGAMEIRDGRIEINAACKMCRLCVRKGPAGAVEYVENDAPKPQVDKSQWQGVMVYVDHVDGEIHPVTYELIGKARELAAKIHHPVYALFMGSGITSAAHEVLHYGVDEVFVYDQPQLARFKIETYATVFEDFIKVHHPAAILVGATTVGRQLAPRVAARMRTGLTADCTILQMNENTDLIQIRPAFGGNIMAQIFTPNHRPQMATVRYKVMDAPKRQKEAQGKITPCRLDDSKLGSRVEVLGVEKKPAEQSIESAGILVVAGRGIKKEADLAMVQALCHALGAQMACTRPLAEAGWVEARRQVGLSGRTVRPKLIITLGVSGAIQFVAGMDHADTIVAINRDEKASIFKVAHYGLVGDIYEIVPALIARLNERKEA